MSGNTTRVLSSNPNYYSRVLPGASLLVPESGSSLDRDAFLLNFSSVHKNAELDYTSRSIDLRNGFKEAGNSEFIDTRQTCFSFELAPQAPFIFPFKCKLKGELCPKLPAGYCLKAGTETAPAFCVEVHSL